MMQHTKHLLFVVIVNLLTLHSLAQQSNEPLKQVNLNDLIGNIFNTNQDAFTSTTPSPVFRPEPTKTTVLEPHPNPNPNPNPPITTSDRVHDGTHSQEYKSCGFEKECVPRFLCDDGSISTTGENIFDIRSDFDCPYLEKCCDIPNKREKPVIDPVPPVTHTGCGYRNPNGVGFRITGQTAGEAEFGEFPWMTAILREEAAAGEILNIYECGGALIAPNAVVTAAHCVNNKKAADLWVRAGEWDTQSKTEVLPYQDRHVKEIVMHEKFNKGSLFNDIAVLFTDSPFDFEENVRPICLPNVQDKFDHSRCYVTGWGKDKFGAEGVYQDILKKIEVPVLPHHDCENKLRQTRLGRYFSFHESFICAGGEEGVDSCKGDGGSPLVCPVPGVHDRFYHAGIVAWGIGCGNKDVPAAYANVAYQKPWLDHILSARGIDPSYYTA